MQELGLSPFIWDNFFTNWLPRSRNTDTTNQLEFFDSWFVMVPRRGGTGPELPRVMIVVLWLSQHRTLTSRYLMVYTVYTSIHVFFWHFEEYGIRLRYFMLEKSFLYLRIFVIVMDILLLCIPFDRKFLLKLLTWNSLMIWIYVWLCLAHLFCRHKSKNGSTWWYFGVRGKGFSVITLHRFGVSLHSLHDDDSWICCSFPETFSQVAFPASTLPCFWKSPSYATDRIQILVFG